jgi:hypothetical protein
MNKREFAAWCQALSNVRLAQVSELCWEAMLFTEDASLDTVRDAVRRSLEECWAARSRRPLADALSLLRDEMHALHARQLERPFLEADYMVAPVNGGPVALMRREGGVR